jgi:integrase
VSAVCSLYRWARHEGVTDANLTPFRPARAHRDAVITLGLDPRQVHAVLDAALSRGDTERNYAFVSLLVFCGFRVSEALGGDAATWWKPAATG